MALADDAQILRGEKDARLVRVFRQDGLNPSQIVREWDAPERGLDTGEATKLPQRLDERANADSRVAGSPVTAARYVVDPQVGKHVFAGLWTVGPVTMEKPDERDRRWVCRQVLTRTWCAGHGYTADGHDATISASHESSEYATVLQALSSHRAEVKRIFNSRMAFRADIPGSYRTEVRWRDYTHESIPFIETSGGREAAAAAAEALFGDELGQIEEVHCEIDKDTNTVVVVAAAIFKYLEEPETIDDLLDAPKVEGPCERETLRALGWNELADGEGYKYTHTWKWFDLKDTQAVRELLEFRIFDKDVLPRLLPVDYLMDSPQLVAGSADEANGRFKFPDGRAWWRIAGQKTEGADDGTLTFTLVAIRADWFGSAEKRVEAAVENPEGAGRSKRVVTPSLDREKAAAVAAAATADEGHILGSVTREQAADGGEDVVVQHLRVWTWQNGDVPAGAAALEGIVASDARKTTTATKTAWEITFDRVKKDEAENLLQAIGDRLTQSGAQGRVTVKDVQNTGEGAVRLVLRAEGVEQKHFSEWLRTGTFFETVHRALSFNIPEEQLEPGGLDPATGDIYTSDRQVNDDGTWDETRDRLAVSEPRHLRFKTKTRPHGRAVDVDVFRNETALPDGLRDGGVAGSASYNDHGRIDGETRDIDQEDDKRRTAAEDHFSRSASETDTDATDRIPDAGLDPATGKLTSVQQQENGDGTFSHTVNEEVPKPCEVSFQTKAGDGHHPRLVTHKVVRNADAIPAELENLSATGTDRVAGSAQHNRFGKVDGEIQTWDAAADDDKGRTAAEDHFSRTVGTSEVGSASRAGEAGVANGTITTVRETEYPDGAIRSEVSAETAKPCEVSFQTKAGDGHHPRLVSHKVVRNADAIPAELANLSATGTDRVAGSAQHNRFGKVDGEIQTWDAAADDDKGRTAAEDHFSRTVGSSEVGNASRANEAGVANGTITTVRETEYPDGAIRSEVSAETAKPCEFSFQTKAGDGHHPRLVTHRIVRNADEIPAEMENLVATGTDRVAGSAQHNRFGKVDGEIQTWDAAADDDRGRTAAEDHFSRTVGSSEVGSESRASEAGVANGTITTVRETEYPDGAIRSEVSAETAKPCEVSFQTKAGDGHHPRLVTHRIVRNADEIPAELANLSATGTNRVAGSAQHNRFGKVDGEIQTWDAAADDDRSATKEEDRFHVETGATGVGADAPRPAEFEDGTIASREIVTFPDGVQRVRAVADRAKPARWSHSYTVRRGDMTGQVLVIAWRNQPDMETPAQPDDDMTLDVDQVQNRYGCWDGTATYSPNWEKRRNGQYASDIEEVQWDQDVIETRRARNYQNQIVDQTRQVRYHHFVKAGNMTWTAAVAHLQGSCMPFEPPALQTFRMNVGFVRGYYADRVTMTVLQDWNPQ